MPLSIIWREIGNVFSECGKLTKSIEAYNNALFYNPNDISALLGKARKMIYSRLRNYEEANKLSDKVLQLDSNNYSALWLKLESIENEDEKIKIKDKLNLFYPGWNI